MRRALLACCAVIIAGVAAYRFRVTSSGHAKPPNVVIYLVDTLRADHLGVYGYLRDTSPVLDAWAKETVVFERAYSPSSWTRPATVSLLSGVDPFRHRVEDRLDVIPSGLRLLAEYLKERGYETLAAVTNPNVLPLWGFDRGFDLYHDLSSAEHNRADTVLDYVTGQIPRLSKRSPFFLYVHTMDPHSPYEPPAPFDSRFPYKDHGDALSRFAAMIAAYDGEVAFGDSQFQRLLDSLRAHDVYRDTMIIFVADHGEHLLNHGLSGHGQSLYEEVIRVPMLIKLPGGAHAGSRVLTPVSLTDVVPTIISVLQQPPIPDLDGRDLMRLLEEYAPPSSNRDIFLSLDLDWAGRGSDVIRGVMRWPLKYLRRVRPDEEELLFDVETDPQEKEDLTELDAKSRRRLAAALDRRLARTSSGVHLQILNGIRAPARDCQAVLRTTGRFVEVSGADLEAGDRFEISQDGGTVHFHCRLENRLTSAGGRHLATDEDGVVFAVSPQDAPIAVEHLGLSEDRPIPLMVGRHHRPEAVPFSFDATRADLAVRDAEELLRGAGGAQKPRAYLAVVSPPREREDVPGEVQDRLRALGYLEEAPAQTR